MVTQGVAHGRTPVAVRQTESRDDAVTQGVPWSYTGGHKQRERIGLLEDAERPSVDARGQPRSQRDDLASVGIP